MDKKFLKRIIAQSQEDLQIISACCAEAKVKTSEIKYLPSNKIFLLSLSRFNREEENDYKKINSIIKFEYVQSSKSKNIDHHNLGQELELLTINVLKKDNNFEIILLFSRNRIITLGVEIIEVTLEDQKFINDKNT